MARRSGEERFVLLANGEAIGRLTASGDDANIAVDYAVDNNGRGAKHREGITLGPGGIPAAWRIEGTSLMGGAVDERLSLDDGRLSWSSQADEGRSSGGDALLYVANDASPYKFGVFARAALAAGGSVGALPSGVVAVQLVRSFELPLANRRIAVDAYALGGAGLSPEFVLLDTDRRLVARLGGDAMLREALVLEELAGESRVFAALDRELIRELLLRIQERIRHRFDGPVRIRNVRVFDPRSGALGDPTTVVVFRGRITAVVPPGQEIDGAIDVDGEGGTLLPGLHEMHAHNSPWTGLFYLAAGVTTTRDMGNDNEMLLDLMPRLDAGELPGPSIVPSGFIEGRSPFSARLGVIPETLEDALSAVHWYAERGYHQIKIYNSLDPRWVRPIAAEARRLGLPTVGHVPAFATPDGVIEDGYGEITHINQLMLGWLLEPGEDTRTPLRLTALTRARDLDLDSRRVQHTVQLMRRHDVGLDTTTVILERLMLSRARQVQPGDRAYLDHMPIGYQRYRKRTYVPAADDEELRAYDEAFPKLLETMNMLRSSGVRMWPGTDDGTAFTLHRELELYVESGMEPAEVLSIATLGCAAHLGRAHTHGSIEPGKAADLVLVDGDPTRDIGAVRRIRMVMKGRDAYFPSEIYEEIGIEPFSAPPPVSGGYSSLTG